MPSPAPFPASHPPSFPALYLYPLNDSFIPKHIALVGGQHIKIGRQTNAKTVPGERNGYFDSKVLSRQHAEVWEENNKIYIKDVKSSNGTFINGERLSPESQESEPFELKSDDIVEFGIDIVGEDNKTIIHHKVAAQVTCVFSAEEAMAASRGAYSYQQQSQAPAAGPSTINAAPQRRPTLQAPSNSMAGMGGLGGGMRQPGKSGLTFELILSRLQGELQKSRETGAELGAVAGAMGEIGEVMGGSQPPNLPPYPHVLPPVRPPQQNSPPQQDLEPSSAALQLLQSQLSETQASLSSYVEKIRTLETLLTEQEGIKREVHLLREMMEERERHHASEPMSDHDSMQSDDDDDNRSIHTVVPHELESVPEEDESELDESDEERNARREELGRPRTPEPSTLDLNNTYEDYEHDRTSDRNLHSGERNGLQTESSPYSMPDELTHRFVALSEQLESALELSRNLQAQHTAAQQTIESLESKVNALEDLVRATQIMKAEEDQRKVEVEEQREKERQANISTMFSEFQKTIEARWDSVRVEWGAERDKQRSDWETRISSVANDVSSISNKVDSSLSSFAQQLSNVTATNKLVFKDIVTSGGLVTPPSPRSLSSDSDSPKRRRNTRRTRTRSHSPSPTMEKENGVRRAGTSSSQGSIMSRSSSPVHGLTDSDISSPQHTIFPPSAYLPTPEGSIIGLKMNKPESDTATQVKAETAAASVQAVNNTQVAFGVFVLGVAAAAVMWRVKE